MKKTSFHSCNVLEVGRDARQLWQFNLSGSQARLSGDLRVPAKEPIPPKLAQRDWRWLFQKRLNIAWLPADQVFVRVIHLPASDDAELRSMVEFQLEKLSPIPVNQIVWSMEKIPHPAAGQQTVLVIIAARSAVEAFLGRLEADKFMADRLELPQLHQLATTPAEANSGWIYPGVDGDRILCLVAWWVGGVLQQVQLLYFNQEQASAALVEQLSKTAWAGEMEGWLNAPLRWHLVAAPDLAAKWSPPLSQWSGGTVEVSEPLARPALAELNARRVAQGESNANLLPAEYGVRYRQQFIDKLWMTGLGAVIGAYILGVAVYFGALAWARWQKNAVEADIKKIAGAYTNTIRLREKIDVLQNQLDLKYAALDAFLVVSTNLPADLTLTSFNLSRGRKLTMSGTAPGDQEDAVTRYAKDLREAKISDQHVFMRVSLPTWNKRPGTGGSQQIFWDLNCDLKQPEDQ